MHIPEFYWNTTSEEFVDWVGSRPIDYYSGTTISAAMITCESKKYEPIKAFAVCYQLQKSLVAGKNLSNKIIASFPYLHFTKKYNINRWKVDLSLQRYNS